MIRHTETDVDTLRRRLARYFGRVPYLSAVAIGSASCPARSLLVVVLSREVLRLARSDRLAGVDDAERACIRVGRLLRTDSLLVSFDASVLRDTETIYRSESRGVEVTA